MEDQQELLQVPRQGHFLNDLQSTMVKVFDRLGIRYLDDLDYFILSQMDC